MTVCPKNIVCMIYRTIIQSSLYNIEQITNQFSQLDQFVGKSLLLSAQLKSRSCHSERNEESPC